MCLHGFSCKFGWHNMLLFFFFFKKGDLFICLFESWTEEDLHPLVHPSHTCNNRAELGQDQESGTHRAEEAHGSGTQPGPPCAARRTASRKPDQQNAVLKCSHLNRKYHGLTHSTTMPTLHSVSERKSLILFVSEFINFYKHIMDVILPVCLDDTNLSTFH